MARTEDDLLRVIRGLLDKAASTDNEPERDALLTKAEAMMVDHDIDRAKLAAAGGGPGTIERVFITVGKSNPDRLLWANVALSRDVRFTFWQGTTRGALTGYTADIAYVQTVVTALLLHRESALRHNPQPWWDETTPRTYNHSFRTGYASRVGARLAQARRDAVKAADQQRADAPGLDDAPSTALVLADKAATVDRFMEEKFGKPKERRLTDTRSAAGLEAGRQAANDADLSGGHNNLRAAPSRALPA